MIESSPSDKLRWWQTAAKIDIKSLQLDELQEKLRELGEPSYRAGQVADWLYQKRASSFDEMTDLPQSLRAQLAEHFSFDKIDIVRVLGSRDTTRKFLFRLSDGNLIESVLIPASPALYGERSDRRTICISTQVGCAYGCKFCASGLEGFSRNLRANEIVDQIIAVERESGDKIDNIVFMGMGEPLANFDNLMRAIRSSTRRGDSASARGISPSRPADLRRKSRNWPTNHCKFAWPFRCTAPPTKCAIKSCRSIAATTSRRCFRLAITTPRKKQRITFEYILIAGVNDGADQAHLLAKHARRLSAKVNLIPYNTVEGLPWSRPSRHRQEKFLSILRTEKIPATLRREKGHDIDAACGQLRLQTKREQ